MKKENSITLQPEVATSVKVSNPFSWTTVQKFYNAMPLEITPCKNVYEAKMYTAALLAAKKTRHTLALLKKNAYVCNATFLNNTTCGFFMSVRQLRYNIKQEFSILIFRKVFKGCRSRRISCFSYVLN